MAFSALTALVGDGADLEAMRFTRRDITRHGRSLQALSKMLATSSKRYTSPVWDCRDRSTCRRGWVQSYAAYSASIPMLRSPPPPVSAILCWWFPGRTHP
jgi:hypothetical protein